jgi:hypothetical protein
MQHEDRMSAGGASSPDVNAEASAPRYGDGEWSSLLEAECAELCGTSRQSVWSAWPAQEERPMELSMRLDTLGQAEVHYLRSRERYRDWPPLVLLAASRQVRIFAYMSRDVAEQLHQQIVALEEATGLDKAEDQDEEVENTGGEASDQGRAKVTERGGSSAFSPSLAQALEKLNELAHQHLPEDAASTGQASNEALGAHELSPPDEEDALEHLQDAFVQMIEVVSELAGELSTDALKLTSRFRCARITMGFTQTGTVEEEDEEEVPAEEVEGEERDLEIELALVLQLFEEGRALTDDLPAVELLLDGEDLEYLHETLDDALRREKSNRRRR